jgi:predicted metal-dependent hydrolase
LTIQVDERARARVSVPYNTDEQDIHDFIRRKAGWIVDKVGEARRRNESLNQKAFDHGHHFLYLGKKYPIAVEEGALRRGRVAFDPARGWRITLPEELSPADRQSRIKDKLLKWYRTQAEEILGGRVFHYARLMGVEPKTIAVRTQKRLWGCCDYKAQSIRLNWQIILSPLEVVDYVVVHELCHLTVPNHSKRFWKKVEEHMPEYQHHRQWLKTNHDDMVLPL